MPKNPYDLFHREYPELAERFDILVEVQRSLNGLDPKTNQLIKIAIQTATRNPEGVKLQAMMAQKSGVTKDEIAGSVFMSLHLTDIVKVLECLPTALAGIETVKKAKKLS